MKLDIIIDKREKHAWGFPTHLVNVSRETLKTGDYALKGDHLFALERKNVEDFVGTLSSGWNRFQKELHRMKEFPAKVIIVESTFSDIIFHKYNHPQVKPAFIIKRIAELTMHKISILFADNQISAAGLGYAILKQRSKQLYE